VRYLAILCLALFLGGCDDVKDAGPGGLDTDTDSDPALVEDCSDGADNDSDGLTDCADSDCAATCDADSDGAISTAFGGDDCDDANAAINPSADEICDGVDNNCDGLVDDDDPTVDASDSPWYADSDQDGFGNDSQVVYRCEAPGGSAVQDNTDCNDNNADIHPLAIEICDGRDNNCDGLTDDEDPALDLATRRVFWIDVDGDGYGDAAVSIDACIAPTGYVEDDQDCDDTDPAVNPSATEVCNAVDDDCNAAVDDLIDQDSDGFIACGLTPDCDDFDPYSYPGAYELCDGIDNDCDTFIPADEDDIDGDGLRVCDGDCDDLDPGLGLTAEWFLDLDGDGHGAGAPEPSSCVSPGPNYVPYLDDDCDDTDPLVYPGAYEICGDYFDADCDGDDCGCGNGLADPSYTAVGQFQDTLPSTTMSMTWDGVDYWSSSGGGPNGDRLAQYDPTGTFLNFYQPNVDWRSVFTKEEFGGDLYGRGYNSSQIQIMSGGPGVFVNDVTLQGGSLDSQSSVAFDTTRREFITLNPNGDVQRWDETGAFVGAVTLVGFGTLGNEGSYPSNRGVAWACDYYLTYSDETLSSWDSVTGARVASTTLIGAGTSFDSNFSISYTNEMVFVVTTAGGLWQGYDVF